MLGYTEEDLTLMQACINISKSYLPLNAAADPVREGLDRTYSFLEGLLVEGHVL